MAQLVARFHGMEEARGSNPLSSTTNGLHEGIHDCLGVVNCSMYYLHGFS